MDCEPNKRSTGISKTVVSFANLCDMTSHRLMPESNADPAHLDGSIDAGLFLLVLTSRPGLTLTREQIAFVCGCSPSYIQQIEQRAMQKLRGALQRRGLHKAP